MFDDVIEANRRYAADFRDTGLKGRAVRGLAVLTCIDSRIDPLRMLGLVPGDAKIIRNAGARVTDDAVRSLILATNLLGVERICVVQHTDCAMAGATDEELRARIGADDDIPLLAMTDQLEALRSDVAALRSDKHIPPTTAIAGFIFDVRSGELRPAEV